MGLDFGLQIINSAGRFDRMPYVPFTLLKLEMEQVDLGFICQRQQFQILVTFPASDPQGPPE